MCLPLQGGLRAGAVFSLSFLLGCSNPSYDLTTLPAHVQDFIQRAENSLGKTSTVYVYPLAEYESLRAVVPSVLQASFKNVHTKQHDAQQFEFSTEVVTFTKRTSHKMQCKGYLRAATELRVILVNADCDVSSYWTPLKRPPSHSIGDFIDWRSDFYYDKRASLVESVLVQEALRERLGYGPTEIIVSSQPLFDDKVLAELLVDVGRPWCTREDAQARLEGCAREHKNDKASR